MHSTQVTMPNYPSHQHSVPVSTSVTTSAQAPPLNVASCAGHSVAIRENSQISTLAQNITAVTQQQATQNQDVLESVQLEDDSATPRQPDNIQIVNTVGQALELLTSHMKFEVKKNLNP